MQDVFLITLALGAVVLIGQIIFDLVGGGGDAGMEDGLDLLSVRSLSGGALLFGAVGLWLASRGLPLFVAVPLALLAGAAGALGTSLLTRQLLRLESDGSLRLENAIGQPGTVYLPVPPRRQGHGLVQFQLQGRTVELKAVTEEASLIPSGASVVVVSVMDGGTVEVTPTPQLEGIDA